MNSLVYILLGISLFCFTLFAVYFLTKHKEDIGKKEFDKKFSSFYDNQRVSLPYSYSYIVIFLVRRLLYTMSMQWFGLAAQLALQLFTSLGSLMFLFAVRPMETPLLNFTEIYNELTFLCCIYVSFLFTNFMPNPSQKESYGWCFIFIVLLNIFINILIVFYLSI